MAWKKHLDRRISRDLRNAIEDEDYQRIIDCLKDAYTWICDNYDDEDGWGYDEDDLERDIENLDNIQLDDFFDEYGLEDMRNEIDYALGEFWDLCDNLRIWVEFDVNESADPQLFTKKSKAKPKADVLELRTLTEADEGEEADTTFGDIDDIELTGDTETDFNNIVDTLKKQSYHDLGDALKDIIDDPKLYDLLSKGFGDGELAKVKMSNSAVGLPVQSLFPTQSEIGLDNSLKFPLKSDCAKYFGTDAITIVAPIITYRKTFVIDGHHRWSQLYMVNPDAKISAINFNYDDANPYRALRNMQGAIAVAKKDVPSSDSKVYNLYDMSEEEIRKYIEDNIQDVCVESIIKVGKAEDKDGVIDYITKNAVELKNRNVPFKDAPERSDMPQTDETSIDVAKKGMTNI